MSSKWYTYVILCDDGSLYKGHTDNLTRRYEQHCKGQGATDIKRHRPLKIVYYKELQTMEEAVTREKYFKSGSGREWLKAKIKEGEKA